MGAGMWWRRAVRVAAVCAGAFASGVAPAGEVAVWHNPPPASMSAMISTVRVDSGGVENGSVRCADDFVLADPSGTGAPVMLSRIDGRITCTSNPGAGHVPVAELWSDEGGQPGALIRAFDPGRFVVREATSGTTQRWLVRFDGFLVVLKPGVRYWLVIAVQTPTNSGHTYYRQIGEGRYGPTSKRILLNGSVFANGADAAQSLYGYRFIGCPSWPVSGVVGMASEAHEASLALVQTGRVSVGPGEACNQLDASGQREATIHSFFNPSGMHARVRMTLESACAEGVVASVYRGVYDPSDLCAGLAWVLEVDGAGVTLPEPIGPREAVHVVVHEKEPGEGFGCSYTLRVDGLSGCCAVCPGDASRDGRVDFDDIVSVLGSWLAYYGDEVGPGDANADGQVTFQDINAVLSNWLREFRDAIGSTDKRAPVSLWFPVSDGATWTPERLGIDPVIAAVGWRGWREAYRGSIDAIRPGYDTIFLHTPFGFQNPGEGPRIDQYLTAPQWARDGFVETMRGLVDEGHRVIVYLGRPTEEEDEAELEASVAPILEAGIRDIGFDGVSHNDPNAGIPTAPVDDEGTTAHAFVRDLEERGITVWVETAHSERLSIVDSNWLKRSDDNGWTVAPGSLILPYPPSAPGRFDHTWPSWFPQWQAELAARGLVAAMLPYHVGPHTSLDVLLAPVEDAGP